MTLSTARRTAHSTKSFARSHSRSSSLKANLNKFKYANPNVLLRGKRFFVCQ